MGISSFVRGLVSLAFVSGLSLSASAMSYDESFVGSDGSIRREALRDFRREIEQRQSEVRANIISNEKYIKGEDSEKKIEKKIKKNKTMQYFTLLLDWVGELENAGHRSRGERLAISNRINELDLALKTDIDPVNTWGQIAKHVKTFSREASISRTAAPMGEASNLVNPETGRVFSAAELENYRARGGDLSRLNPPNDNGVIENIRDLSRVHARDRYAAAHNPFHDGLEIVYPANNVVKFDEVRKKQSHPKLTVTAVDSKGVKREYKLKVGMEIHGETTSAALASSLGLYHDLGRYVTAPKVQMGEMTYEKFKFEWNSYYADYDLDKLVARKGRDAQGYYVVFVDGLFEPELDEDVLKRVGPWYWGAVDHKSRREFRGLFLFDIWIHNTDLKEGENNKLVLKAKADGTHDLYYLQQDLGYSFGHYFREKPLDYRWSVVESVTGDGVQFDYRNFQPNAGFEHVTWSDARWMVRKIAALSRRQITEAVMLAHWPDRAPYNYQSLIIEKLIARRNEMVKAFDLMGERLPSGEVISVMPENRAIENEVQPPPPGGIPGKGVDYAPEVRSMIVDPLMKSVSRMLKEGALSLLGSVNDVSLEPTWFGWDDGVVSEVLINVNRRVVQNPKPTSIHDAYIVRDDFKVGARLGYGLTVSGDLAYVRGFTLVYPVQTRDQGLNGKAYLSEIIKSGYESAQASLPPGHILISESYLEGRGRFKADGGTISLGYDATVSRVALSRSLISRKVPGKIVFFEDQVGYNELAQRIYTKLSFVKIHHFKQAVDIGRLDRDAYELPVSEARLVNGAFFDNDFAEVRRLGQHRKLTSKFWSTSTKINIFGIWQREKELRRDSVDIWSLDRQGRPSKHQSKLVIEMSAEESWPLSIDREDHSKHVQFTADVGNDGRAMNPLVKMSFMHVDKDVTNRELTTGYLPFIDGVAGMKNFLHFSPLLHATQNGYGELTVRTDMDIYQEGLAKLMRVDEAQFNRVFMEQLGMPGRSRDSFNSKYRDSNGEEFLNFYGKAYSTIEMDQAAERFVSYWRKVATAPTMTEKAEALVIALYKAATKSGEALQPIVFRTIAALVGRDNMFMEARILVPSTIENKLPGKLSPLNRIGEKRSFSDKRQTFLFDMSEGLEIYQSF